MNISDWFKETRPAFLLMTPITFSVGLAIAFTEGYFDPVKAFLGLIGTVLAHASVNMFNDYFDHKSGLDYTTDPTPFSGGSGFIPSGILQPRQVFIVAMTFLAIGGAIGLYFVSTTGIMLLPLVIAAAGTIFLYTPVLSRLYVGELLTGLNFGPLMSLGGYFIMTGRYGTSCIAAGAVPGILVGVLLYLNEFPDVKPDRNVGRRNIIMVIGLEKAAKLYGVFITSAYIVVIAGVMLGYLPLTTFVTFLTLPIAVKAIKGVMADYGNIKLLTPAMGDNVKLVLSMTTLTSVGIILGGLL
jgi:1,4-dihydroxy-2-naphthoate octaprenyltransferase